MTSGKPKSNNPEVSNIFTKVKYIKVFTLNKTKFSQN